jgi:hypothetical protein
MGVNRQPLPTWVRTSLVLLAGLTLVGCTPGAVRVPTAPPVVRPPAAAATPTTQVALAPATAEPTLTALPPFSSPEEPTPTIRRGLHATDPGSVVLASGRPQLVEFFAFW